MVSRKAFRLQSAMEYLMTYGWAILIIAVVLGALFSLGVFNGSAFAVTACTASSGYQCTNPTYSHGSGNLSITFGQNTGTGWNSANVLFVNQTFQSTVSTDSPTALATLFNSVQANTLYGASGTGLASGQVVSLTLPVSSKTSTKLGTVMNGYIWVEYTTAAGGAPSYAQVATIQAKAV